jgi:hypothetical protein
VLRYALERGTGMRQPFMSPVVHRTSTVRRGLRLLSVVATVIVPVSAMTTLTPGVAGAVSPVVGTGALSCGTVTGSLKFSPALTTAGGSSDIVTTKLTLSGCGASGGNVTTSTFTGKASGKLTVASNSCSLLSSPTTTTGTIVIKWTAKAGTAKLEPTTLPIDSVTGVASGANGDDGLTLTNQVASGSFAAGITGEVDSNATAAAVNSALGCGAKSGLKSLDIVSGDVYQIGVLTVGSLDGPSAGVGDELGGNPLVSGLLACNSGDFSGNVAANPLAPGSAVLTITELGLGSCDQGVSQVEFNDLPLSVTISDAPGDPVTLNGVTGTVVIGTDPGDETYCNYQANLVGSFANGTSTISFTNQTFDFTGGEDCDYPASAQETLTVGPIVDLAGTTSVFPFLMVH